MSSALLLVGCSVDGSAVRGSADYSVAPEATSAAPNSAAPDRSAPSTDRSTEPSTKTSTPSPSSAASAAPSSAPSGVAAKAMTMSCDTYKGLTPNEQKEVVVEIGKQLNKKQLVENDRSWAIVNTFCAGGRVRDSQGVRDSE